MAPIQPLAQAPPYATGAALKKKKKKGKKEKTLKNKSLLLEVENKSKVWRGLRWHNIIMT